MAWKKAWRWSAATALGLAGLVLAGAAQARDVTWSVGLGAPGAQVIVGNAPVYVVPPVVVHAPPRYHPPPRYYGPPARVYHAPPVYYVPPPAVHYRPQPIYYGPPAHFRGHGHKHRHGHGHRHRHDGWRR